MGSTVHKGRAAFRNQESAVVCQINSLKKNSPKLPDAHAFCMPSIGVPTKVDLNVYELTCSWPGNSLKLAQQKQIS
jgi:hypothetical protein